jgi:hypothetical protein
VRASVATAGTVCMVVGEARAVWMVVGEFRAVLVVGGATMCTATDTTEADVDPCGLGLKAGMGDCSCDAAVAYRTVGAGQLAAAAAVAPSGVKACAAAGGSCKEWDGADPGNVAVEGREPAASISVLAELADASDALESTLMVCGNGPSGERCAGRAVCALEVPVDDEPWPAAALVVAKACKADEPGADGREEAGREEKGDAL